MLSHGTPSIGQLAPFVTDAMRAVLLLSEGLDPQVRDRYTGQSGQMQALFRSALLGGVEIPPTPEQTAAGIVKVVTIQIGGGRTTDQMVEAARPDCASYINPDITQAHMPSGFGPLRYVTLEFRQFDHEPYTDEVTAWQNEPGHAPSGYEDGLRFREYDPEAQRKQPHIFIPESPWCDASAIPCALFLWGDAGRRGLDLSRCRPRSRWSQDCLFARRRYLPLAV